MGRIDLLPGGAADLRALRTTDRKAAATIAAVLQEADADREIIDKLTSHGDVEIGDHLLNVKGWAEVRNGGDNLWRFRVLDSPGTTYRVIYGFDWRVRRIGILAVVKKDGKTYKISEEIFRRILGDWRTATGGAST